MHVSTLSVVIGKAQNLDASVAIGMVGGVRLEFAFVCSSSGFQADSLNPLLLGVWDEN